MNNLNQNNSIGIGRRKSAIASVKLIPGTGEIQINKIIGLDYLQLNLNYLNICKAPLEIAGVKDSFDIHAKVCGGGLTGQAQAIQLGVARALCELDKSYRTNLKTAGLLTRDARIKERKKYGLKKARKASQYSKR